jgi:hypothetical protein
MTHSRLPADFTPDELPREFRHGIRTGAAPHGGPLIAPVKRGRPVAAVIVESDGFFENALTRFKRQSGSRASCPT